MKTLDEIIVFMGGKWPSAEQCRDMGFITYYSNPVELIMFGLFNVRKNEFQQRAKELGFINGYRWGVEYKTDGKRPDLPDDVCAYGHGGRYVSFVSTPITGIDWHRTEKFVICDARYRPADTSYLGKPALEHVLEEESWYDYDNQKALRLPPVGSMVLGFVGENFRPFECAFIGIDRAASLVVEKLDGDLYRYKKHQINLKPLDHNRKAKAERKRVVDSAYDEAIKAGCVDFGQWLNHLYDKGFLKLPE